MKPGIINAAELAKMLIAQLLQPRRVQLKHKAPRSTYVHQLRRDLSADRKRPMEMLLAIAFADLEDRVPSSVVTQWARSFIAICDEYEQKLKGEAVNTDPLPLVQRVLRADAELTAAQNDLLAHPDSLDAIDRVLATSAVEEAEQNRLIDRLRARRARLTASNREIAVV